MNNQEILLESTHKYILRIAEQKQLTTEENIYSAIVNYMIFGISMGGLMDRLLDYRKYSMEEIRNSAHHANRPYIPDYIIILDSIRESYQDIILSEEQKLTIIKNTKKQMIKDKLNNLHLKE